MSNVLSFSFTCKSVLSHSGVCFLVSTRNNEETFKLYRQFYGCNEEFLCEFNRNYGINKLIPFKINTKLRDIHGLVDRIKSEIEEDDPEGEHILDENSNLNETNSKILQLWQKYFNSQEFILNNYNGYMFVDKQKKIWIYDIVPAVKAFSQVDKDSLIPVPGSNVTYRIVSGLGSEEIYSKNFLIPDLIAGDLHLHDIFEQDIYLYHVALFYKDKCLWGTFTSKPSKRKTGITYNTTVNNKDLLCNIKPDISAFPKLKPTSHLFTFDDHPPRISSLELMESYLRITRIKTDTGNSNKFNSLSFETKFFKSTNFPKTLSRLFPYK